MRGYGYSNAQSYDGFNDTRYIIGEHTRYWRWTFGALTYDLIMNTALENRENGAVKRCNTCGWKIEFGEQCLETGGNMGGRHWYYHDWCYPLKWHKPTTCKPDQSKTHDVFRVLEKESTKQCGTCKWWIYTSVEKYTRAGGHYYHDICYKVKR